MKELVSVEPGDAGHLIVPRCPRSAPSDEIETVSMTVVIATPEDASRLPRRFHSVDLPRVARLEGALIARLSAPDAANRSMEG